MVSSLCLGTVQFGMDYGITNNNGKVSEVAVKEILEIAQKQNINYLDTAQSYGNSEEVIGRCKPVNSQFKIISKLFPLDKKIINIEILEKKFFKSLSNLKCKEINSFFLHRSEDIKSDESQLLLEWLKSLIKRKLVKNIGVSIYDEFEIYDLPLDFINIIQIPLSIYNQNVLSSKMINLLKNKGISIYARSCFLQGLLLQPSSNWPKFLSDDFCEHHKVLEGYIRDRQITLLDMSIAFLKSIDYVDIAAIGITNKKELNQLTQAWNNIKLNLKKDDFSRWNWHKPQDNDPRLWKVK